MITTTWVGTRVCPACSDPIQLGPLDAPPYPMETTWMIYGSHKKEGGREGPWPLRVCYTRVVLPDGRLCCDSKCAAKTLELDTLPAESRKAVAAEWRAVYRLAGLGEYGDKVSVGAWIRGPARETKTREIA